jgi:hypothetical protein
MHAAHNALGWLTVTCACASWRVDTLYSLDESTCALIMWYYEYACADHMLRAGAGVLLLDGLEFFRMAFALRRDGPPPVYPPRNGTFLIAIVRGLVTITIGAMLSHSNRHRLAALANYFGWNHVTLTLNHVQRAPRRVRFCGVEQDAAGGCDVGAMGGAISTDHPTESSASASGSSHLEFDTDRPAQTLQRVSKRVDGLA